MLTPAFRPVDDAGQDLASFLDLSFTETTSSIPLPTPSLFPVSGATPLQALAFSNAFRQEDALLDSPLGLSPVSLTASPFDLSSQYDFTSPLLSGAFGTPDSLDGSLGTPDLGHEDYPSLFSNVAPATTWSAAPVIEAQAPVLAPTSIAVSPSVMSLDGGEDLATASPAVVEETKVTAIAEADVKPEVPVALPRQYKGIKTQEELDAEAAALKTFTKDRFTGHRNTRKKAIDFDAPTLPKNYIMASATSRKRAPASVAKQIESSGSNKRARRDSTPLPTATPDGGELDPSELPDEVLSAIELKRRQNTLAARRSRMRKAGHLAELQASIDERDNRIAQLEEELLALKRRLGEA